MRGIAKKWSQVLWVAPFLLIMLATSTRAVPFASPTNNTWDCVITGHRQGTAYFQFFPDNTFTVTEVIVPNAVSTNSSLGRGGTGVGRNGSSSGGGNVFVPTPQIFGGEFVTNGVWGFDLKGHTIGAFVETSLQENCTITPIPFLTNGPVTVITTPPVTQTNNPTTDPTFCVSQLQLGATNLGGGLTNYAVADICFTNVIICNALTNTINFVGTVSANRIILNCSTTFGNTTYKGVPGKTLPDISTNYFGIKRQNGIEFVEFLTIANEGIANENIYDVSLTGPGYTYTGAAILSSQKRISFDLGLAPAIFTNPPVVIRAVTGSFNPKKNISTTTGWDSAAPLDRSPSQRIHFTVAPEP